MPYITNQQSFEEIKHLVFQLSQKDLLTLLTDIQMRLHPKVSYEFNELDQQTWLHAIGTNPSFAFLHDPEEDIYTLEDGKPVSYEG
jgi:hypothetical protein